jgi:hypothetical protein
MRFHKGILGIQTHPKKGEFMPLSWNAHLRSYIGFCAYIQQFCIKPNGTGVKVQVFAGGWN